MIRKLRATYCNLSESFHEWNKHRNEGDYYEPDEPICGICWNQYRRRKAWHLGG